MSKQKIQFQRLEKLATHLEKGKLGHKIFDFGEINDVYDGHECPIKPAVRGCGTVGCAMGELPVIFRRHWKFQEPQSDLDTWLLPELRHDVIPYNFEGNVAKFFGVDENIVQHLFYPDSQDTYVYGGQPLDASATKKQVASNIREFVKLAKAGKIVVRQPYDEGDA